MVGTRHCCWGECKTDSRYPEKWPESLKELEKSGQKVFIPFPKPAKDLAKCKRWLVACSREFFTEKNVNKNKVKTFKRWQAAYLHRRETFETFYILLHWGDLFQGSYSLKFERWYLCLSDSVRGVSWDLTVTNLFLVIVRFAISHIQITITDNSLVNNI